jgi:L-threonylcarbamoyladenylate synthase
MPGPITIILKKKPGVFDYISSGKDTIGIRIPDNEIILEILKQSKLPIVAPSANISGKPSGIILSEILKDFDGKVDICIDGGKAKLSEPSTIVEVIDNKPVILRQGRIEICI